VRYKRQQQQLLDLLFFHGQGLMHSRERTVRGRKKSAAVEEARYYYRAATHFGLLLDRLSLEIEREKWTKCPEASKQQLHVTNLPLQVSIIIRLQHLFRHDKKFDYLILYLFHARCICLSK